MCYCFSVCVLYAESFHNYYIDMYLEIDIHLNEWIIVMLKFTVTILPLIAYLAWCEAPYHAEWFQCYHKYSVGGWVGVHRSISTSQLISLLTNSLSTTKV